MLYHHVPSDVMSYNADIASKCRGSGRGACTVARHGNDGFRSDSYHCRAGCLWEKSEMAQFLGRFRDDAIALANGDNESPLSPENVAALADWWNSTNCDVMDWAESGLRALGLEALANRQRSFKSQAGCEIPLGGGYPRGYQPPNFPGGQCPGTKYRFFVSWTTILPDGGGNDNAEMWGPVDGLEVIPNPNFGNSFLLRLLGRSSNGSPRSVTFASASNGTLFSSFQVDSVTVESGPDDCGDKEGGGPSYPPPGNLPSPPSVGDTFGEPSYVPTTVPINGTDVPIDIEFGPPSFLGKDGIRVPINGVPIDISPDGGITVPDTLDSDESPGENVNTKLDEILEKLEEEIGGELTAIGCDGEPTSAQYLGVGLQGLNAAIQTGFALRSAALTQLCPVGGDVALQEVELLGTSVPFGVSEVKTVSLPSDAREMYIEVTGDPPGLRVFKLAGNESEARFGFWSVRYDNGNDDFSEAPTEIFTRMATMSLPSANGRDRSVRISLKSGLGYSLFIQREVS